MNNKKIWLLMIIVIASLLAIVNFNLMRKEKKAIAVKDEKLQLQKGEIKLEEKKPVDAPVQVENLTEEPTEKESPEYEKREEPLKGPQLN
ncbi:MAG: hypothetical protein Q8O30_12110 [Candidatus Omnitrophota bacterium]|nr:hypothetical protein [Candidatus Omnitrophota bacterium]